MSRLTRLSFGIAGLTAAYLSYQQWKLGVTQQKMTTEQMETANHFSALSAKQHILESYRRHRDGKSYAQIHQELIDNSPSFVPKTSQDRRQILEYTWWLGTLTSLTPKDMSTKELSSLTAVQVNTLASNAYVMDQLLLLPENNGEFIEVAKRIVEHQASNQSSVTRFEEAKQFFDNFEKSVKECQPTIAKLKKERAQRAHTGSAMKESYAIHCPYVQRYVDGIQKAAQHEQRNESK